MKTLDKNQLPDDVEVLKQLLVDQHGHIQRLEEIVKLFQGSRFGKSSEKSPDQAELFDEADVESTDQGDLNSFGTEDIKAEQASPAKNPNKKSGRKPLPKELDRIVIEHDIREEAKTCDCGCQKIHIGDEVSEQLDIIPAVIQVLQHRRKKYVCKTCEGKILVADLPAQPITKSNASPGLLAHIAMAKYQDGLPLYRMETIFSRLGIHLPRNTQANWMIKCTELLQPLYNLLNDQLLSSGYVHMDEPPRSSAERT